MLSLQVFTDLNKNPCNLFQFVPELRHKTIPTYQRGRTKRRLCIIQNLKHRLKRQIFEERKEEGEK